MTTCYLPPPTPIARASNAIRAAFRTARMQMRQLAATFSPWGWCFIGLAGTAIVFGASMAFAA